MRGRPRAKVGAVDLESLLTHNQHEIAGILRVDGKQRAGSRGSGRAFVKLAQTFEGLLELVLERRECLLLLLLLGRIVQIVADRFVRRVVCVHVEAIIGQGIEASQQKVQQVELIY